MNKMNKFEADAVDIADLIADMALKGATREELERITRYSIAVIDASKEFNVAELVTKYREDSEESAKHGQVMAREDFVNKMRLTSIYERLSKPNKKAIDGYDQALEEIDRLKERERILRLIYGRLDVENATDAIGKICEVFPILPKRGGTDE